jgi:hypothetical protein
MLGDNRWDSLTPEVLTTPQQMIRDLQIFAIPYTVNPTETLE